MPARQTVCLRILFSLLSLPIPVVIHQDRSSISLFSVQTNRDYESAVRGIEKREGIETGWAEELKQMKCVITSQEEVLHGGKEVGGKNETI